MKQKIDIKPEMITAYEKLLANRAAACRAEISVQEKHLKRIEVKKIDLEKSLRMEISEGALGVLKAVGLDVPRRTKKEEIKTIEMPLTIEKPEIKKSEEKEKVSSGLW